MNSIQSSKWELWDSVIQTHIPPDIVLFSIQIPCNSYSPDNGFFVFLLSAECEPLYGVSWRGTPYSDVIYPSCHNHILTTVPRYAQNATWSHVIYYI